MYGDFNRFEYEDSVIKNIQDREVRELAKDLGEYCELYRKYEEGDCSYEDFLRYKREFKQKWLRRGCATKRLKATCDKAIEEFKKELHEMIGEE